MAIEIAGIDHIVIRVSEMPKALEFYCGVLGCNPERQMEQYGMVQLRAGGALIDLLEVKNMANSDTLVPKVNKVSNIDHFALRLKTFDEAKIRNWLNGHGIKIPEVEQRYGADGFGPSVYIHDPDGNLVELKGPKTCPPVTDE